MEWQPIETAPRDGSLILVIDSNDPDDTGVAYWSSYIETGWHSNGCVDGVYIFYPTHWMTLPAPPTN